MAHKKRAAQDIAKADYSIQDMNREALFVTISRFDNNTLPILGQIAALGGDIQGIKQLLHSCNPFKR
jgi:hypothetical protein